MIQKIVTAIGNILIILVIGILLGQNEHFIGKVSDYLVSLLNTVKSHRDINIFDDVNVKYDENNDKVVDGYFLLTSHYTGDTAVILVDSKGKVQHSWDIERGVFNEKTKEIHDLEGKDLSKFIFGISDAEMSPEGDLFFTQDIRELANFRSQRAGMLDKYSNVKWSMPGAFHHDVYNAEDGNFYSIGSYLDDGKKIFGNTNDDFLYILGAAKVISPEGKLLEVHKIDEGFIGSEYEGYLYNFTFDIPPQLTAVKNGKYLVDAFHTNSAQYLSGKRAENIEFAEEGDILFSMRGNNTIGIYRPSLKKVIWAKRGEWKHQHFVRADESGNIYIYDNEGKKGVADVKGKPVYKKTSRIIKYDTRTEKTEMFYPLKEDNNEDVFHSYWRGFYKFFDNGTYLASSAEQGKIVQVDDNGDTIWQLNTFNAEGEKSKPAYNQKIPGVRYYEKDYINFKLCGGVCGHDNGLSN